MQLVLQRGCAPRFPLEQFLEQRKGFGPDIVWDSLDSLQQLATSQEKECRGPAILGKIRRETAQEWLSWKYGDLYAVGYCGVVLFCLDGGTVVC